MLTAADDVTYTTTKFGKARTFTYYRLTLLLLRHVWRAPRSAGDEAAADSADRMRTGKRNRHRRPDSPDPNPKSKRDDISINQLT
ncbi:hypothetical protein EVAR_47419_1 [Eumeta japonica]|uniref:Uncharacterized protein n=1 Tax=Eumeta variegata TaxID=151549 RepID=A0A4C1Y2C6_EUMVA|nr:hypothetical protein EVAR_47419_1 [Eumeta japonica]